jgi:hypothetical protein
MENTHRFNFISSAYILDALKIVFTNFENFWSEKSFERDLTEVIKTFLKIKFPKKKRRSTFSSKNNNSRKGLIKSKKSKDEKRFLLKRLEKEIMKRDDGKPYVLEHLVNAVFLVGSSTTTTATNTSGKKAFFSVMQLSLNNSQLTTHFFLCKL